MTRPADRRIRRFEGCWNVRDLGGLLAAGGKHIRAGLVFRSAALDRATDDDVAAIAAIGLRRVFDLRADRERRGGPWCASLGLAPWSRDYGPNAGDLRSRLTGDDGPDMHAAMVHAYRRLPFEQAPALAAIFTALADGETPLLFHCAVGKDRTGAVAALLLAVLGVAPETILADYLVTNDHADLIRQTLVGHPDLTSLDPDAPHVWTPLATAHGDYLAALFDTVAAHAGSVEAFLGTVAGIDGPTIARIRDHLLETRSPLRKSVGPA